MTHGNPSGRSLEAAKTHAIASFEITSVAAGYRALDLLTRRMSVQILEASVVAAGHFWILAEGDDHDFNSLVTELRAVHAVSGESTETGVLDHVILAVKDRSLLESVYALSSHQLEESLIVVECETISGLLASIHSLQLNHHLKIIESKIHRGSKAGAHAFITGSSEICRLAVEETRTRLKARMRSGTVELIEAPNVKFREHFNISGHA